MDRRGTANPSVPAYRVRSDERVAPARRDVERERVAVVARRLGSSVGALEQYLRLKRAEVEPIPETEA